MRTAWGIFAFVVWLPVATLLVHTFGGLGGTAAMLLLPLVWVVWVNLREHWPGDDDPPSP